MAFLQNVDYKTSNSCLKSINSVWATSYLSEQISCRILSSSHLYLFPMLPFLVPLKKMSIFILQLLATFFLKSYIKAKCSLLETAYDSHRYIYFLSTCSVPALTPYWHDSDNIAPALYIKTYNLSYVQRQSRQEGRCRVIITWLE